MSLCGLPIISFDHVQFHIRYQLFLFEKIIFVNSKYTYAKRAEIELYGDGHGSLEEFFEGLKTLAEAIKVCSPDVFWGLAPLRSIPLCLDLTRRFQSRNTRFDQFGNQVLIEVKKAPSLKVPPPLLLPITALPLDSRGCTFIQIFRSPRPKSQI